MKEKILSSLDEIKTISDPFRLKILFLFDEDNTPMTVKQMAVKLQEVPSKVHYHVKELERIGVLEIIYTKEKAGIVEKFYLPTADVFKVERNIGNPSDEIEHLQVGENLFLAMQQDFSSNNKLKKPGENASLNYGLYHMTEEENEQLKEIIKDFLENKDQREGTKPYMFGYALFRKYQRKGLVVDGEQ